MIGHCINFGQDISLIADILPRLPADVPIVIIQKRNAETGLTNDMRVRRVHVEMWLRWLKAHSPVAGYKNLKICDQRLAQLPVNGFLEGLRIIESDEVEVDIALHRDNADNIENPESYNDNDGNPSSDSGVPMPAESLISENNAITNILHSINGKYFEIITY